LQAHNILGSGTHANDLPYGLSQFVWADELTVVTVFALVHMLKIDKSEGVRANHKVSQLMAYALLCQS